MLKLRDKKGNLNILMAVAFSLITVAVIVGIGLTVLAKLGATQAGCAAGYTYSITSDKCLNATGGDPTTPTGSAYTSIAYGMTQLGSSGLLSWLPAIIALIIGVFFLTYFMGGKKKY